MMRLVRVTIAMGCSESGMFVAGSLGLLKVDIETIIFQSMRQKYWNDGTMETNLLEPQAARQPSCPDSVEVNSEKATKILGKRHYPILCHSFPATKESRVYCPNIFSE